VGSEDFDEFYRATSRRTLRFAYAMCGDLTTAQDLTQEGYVRAWQQWRSVSGYENPEAWVRVVVNRLATDRWRHLRVHHRFEASARPPRPSDPPGEDTVLLTAALRKLPARQRQVLVLHYLMDMSIVDIAAETGAAEGTVKSWLGRGRSALAALIEPVGSVAHSIPEAGHAC
jgi:RNA polymerase sigma-70 factor, ECF subfamily